MIKIPLGDMNLGVDRKLLLDILVTAIEWSCVHGYWGQVEDYCWPDWYVDGDMDEIKPTLEDTDVLLKVRDVFEHEEWDYDNEPSTEFQAITLLDMAGALGWALVTYNHLFSWCVHYDKDNKISVIDDVDYDAIGADVILQKIVLGDVLYG